MMLLRAAPLSALLVFAAASCAAAGPIVDAAERAEALQAQGKVVEALDALDAAVDVVWNKAPLAFRKVELIDTDGAAGAGSERADRTFEPDEKLTVRVEPVGFGYGTSDAGANVSFTGDLTLENATGQILTEAKDLFSVSVDRPAGHREFDMRLSFQVPYVRPGDYTARFTLRDRNSDKTGSFDVPFTVAAPVAAGAPAATDEKADAAPAEDSGAAESAPQ